MVLTGEQSSEAADGVEQLQLQCNGKHYQMPLAENLSVELQVFMLTTYEAYLYSSSD